MPVITLDTYPGRIIKVHVDSVIRVQTQGQGEASGDLPRTIFTTPPGRFPVKLVVAEHDNALFLAAGARGAAAIYTEHLSISAPGAEPRIRMVQNTCA